MEEFEQQDGVAFVLIYYSKRDQYFYVRFQKMKEFWERMQDGGRKSFRFEELEADYEIPKGKGNFIPYLIPLQKDLENR